ncbi:hypothetical protein [Sphingomonas cavernae]|uniref:Uncharacterized protein n=1 Tax=Sphingomonas cavernae TaxID=2320861 RepID=A0A418WM12_9SPHN|nr:hypothetical protein [Sphingomonas cavernae]RJF91045.1 hypothetical protein D3876_12920 [Sphingomonas cavernae]
MNDNANIWSDDDENNRYEKLDPEEVWDHELASDLIGCTLYVGLTFVDNEGNFRKREQVFGTVESVSASAGIKLIQTNGEIYSMAPVLDAIESSGPESYQLTDDDELVENPNFVAWITAIDPPLN